MQHKQAQAGMSLIGFVVVLALVGFLAYIGMKLFPMYSEYYAVKQSLESLSREPGIASQGAAAIKDKFFKRLYINYSDNVKPEHVKLSRVDDGALDMQVRYEIREPLIGNLDVIGRFDTTQRLSNAVPGD